MEQLFYESIQSLNPENKGWKIQRPPDSEEYFLANFNIQVGFDEEKLSAIWSNDPADFGFTWDELVIETKRLEAEYEANSYQRDRASQFPELKEQLDLLFHDMTSGKGNKNGNWYKAVNKVKTDNPKPE